MPFRGPPHFKPPCQPWDSTSPDVKKIKKNPQWKRAEKYPFPAWVLLDDHTAWRVNSRVEHNTIISCHETIRPASEPLLLPTLSEPQPTGLQCIPGGHFSAPAFARKCFHQGGLTLENESPADRETTDSITTPLRNPKSRTRPNWISRTGRLTITKDPLCLR